MRQRREHDQEKIERATHLPDLPGSQLLGPSALLPLLQNTGLLNGLLEGTGADSAGKRGDGVGSKDEVSVRKLLAGDRCGGAVNECLF